MVPAAQQTRHLTTWRSAGCRRPLAERCAATDRECRLVRTDYLVTILAVRPSKQGQKGTTSRQRRCAGIDEEPTASLPDHSDRPN